MTSNDYEVILKRSGAGLILKLLNQKDKILA